MRSIININKPAQNWHFIYVINIKICVVSQHEKECENHSDKICIKNLDFFWCHFEFTIIFPFSSLNSPPKIRFDKSSVKNSFVTACNTSSYSSYNLVSMVAVPTIETF